MRCNICNKRLARSWGVIPGIEAAACAECSNDPPDCDVCGLPVKGAVYYTKRTGAAICLPCFQESDEDVAILDNRRAFKALWVRS